MSYTYQGLEIRDTPGNPYAGAYIGIFKEAQRLPASERKAAAQVLAGDEWQIVPKSGALPPLYLLDDLWQALGGDPADFDDWHTRHGSADTWGQLLAIVRRTFRPVCGKPVDGEYCVLTAPLRETDMHICHGPSDVGIDELPPIPAAQPDRPEPVDPWDVATGDVVDYERLPSFKTCRVVGEVQETFSDQGTSWSLLIHGTWWNASPDVATVRILHAAEPEPDEAAEIRTAVTAWVQRFRPGDIWDPEDRRDLESALKGTVEANPVRRDPANVEALYQVLYESHNGGGTGEPPDERWRETYKHLALTLDRRNVRVVSRDA